MRRLGVFLLLCLLGLSGCHHAHRPVVKPVKVVAPLDKEHHQTHIVVVKKATPKRKCWRHANHWHCYRK